MNDKIDEQRISAMDEAERISNRKVWITPVVSESPVNELTDLTFAGTGIDGAFSYS